MRRLRSRDRLVDSLDFLGGGSRFGGCGLGGGLGLDPARVEQLRLDASDLLGELAVAFGRARLATKLARALLLLAEDFPQPLKVRLGRTQLLLGVLAPGVQPGNAGGFLEQLPPLDRLCGDDRADLALADQRRRMRAGGGIGEQQRDVLGADVAAVDPIGRSRAALDPAGDLALRVLLAAVALEQHRHFGEIARRTRCGAGEDHVVHAAAAQRLGAGLAHRPADRLEQVGLAAAIGSDHAGEPAFDPQFGRLDEALEAGKLQALDVHPSPPGPKLMVRPPPSSAMVRAAPTPQHRPPCRRSGTLACGRSPCRPLFPSR